MEFDKEILRWVILIGAAPVWIPFLFTLWRDFNDALRLDGGLLGSPPTGRNLDIALKELAEKPDVLISEPIVRPGDLKHPRLNSPSRRAPVATHREPRFR
jgi:hypothetical protein